MKKRTAVETGSITGALELKTIFMSSDPVVWEHILRGTVARVQGEDRTGDFPLSSVLKFESRVLFCNQESQASMSGEHFVVLEVRTVHSDRVLQKVEQANTAHVQRLMGRIDILNIKESTARE